MINQERINFLLSADPATLSDFDREAREFLQEQIEGPEPKKLSPGHSSPVLRNDRKVGMVFVTSTAETFDRNEHKLLWDEWER